MVDIRFLVDGKKRQRRLVGYPVESPEAVNFYAGHLRDLRFVRIQGGDPLKVRSVTRQCSQARDRLLGLGKKCRLLEFAPGYSEGAGESKPQIGMVLRAPFFFDQVFQKLLAEAQLGSV